MKNIFLKVLCVFAFILNFSGNVFSQDLGITSVVYDNSAAILAINSFETDNIDFLQTPTLNIVENENIIYFDINPATLNSPTRELVINSQEIKSIKLQQLDGANNVVRVIISHEQNFNPKNIKLLKINNSLFVKFKQPKLSNYYFQHVYSDLNSSISNIYENTIIQTPVIQPQDGKNNILNQINSAFNINTTQDNQNYILARKNLIFPSKFYINNVNVKNGIIHLNGVGSATFSKPIILTNPSRIAFDIKSTVVNPAIRNRDIQISDSESLKLGQFDKNTARIVLTTPTPDKYLPVIYGDTQHIAIINKDSPSANTLFGTNATLTSVTDEINDDTAHSMKLVFSKPIVYGLLRDKDGLEIYLYNVDKTNNINLKKSLIFDNANISALKNGGYKIVLTDKGENTFNIHTGADGKTLRIKEKGAHLRLPVLDPTPPPVVVPAKSNGKHYIVIDPGHGGSDVGATRNGIHEKNITLDVSNRVADLLRKKGYEVKMTRDCDKTVSLQERVEFSENLDPDIFISIHVNSSNSETPNGLETHYYKDNSLQLAKTIHASMLNNINANNRGLFKSKFYVINHTTAPAVLVEIGFLSNKSERAQLVSETRKQATAKAIAEGIDGYFKK